MTGDVHRSVASRNEAQKSATCVTPKDDIEKGVGDDADGVEDESRSSASPKDVVEDFEKSKTSQTWSVSSKTVDVHNDRVGDNGPANVTVVVDLSGYRGETLQEKIDDFIQVHPVAMFNRTWCLFSVDAQDFLIHDMHVSVHSIEVDIHPQGKEILKYIWKKTGHETTPVIFIRGEFLGGFDHVNALYSEGVLEREYLNGLSHADQCQEIILKSNLRTDPIFWYPSMVDANAGKITSIMTSFVCIIALIATTLFSWGPYVTYGITVELFLRVLTGPTLSILCRIARVLALPMGNTTPRAGRPKQFATMFGLLVSILASISYLIPFVGHTMVGSVFVGLLAIALEIDGIFDYCLGCTIFKWGVKLGIISK
jgi:glutaredoxin